GLKDAVFRSLAGDEPGLVVQNRKLPSVLEPPLEPPPVAVPKPQEDWRKPPLPLPTPPIIPRWLAFTLVGLAAAVLVPVAFWLAGTFMRGQKKPEEALKSNGAVADVRLPDNCKAAPDAAIVLREDKKYYRRVLAVLDDGTRIPFLLIPKDRGSDPDTFYMM